MIISIPLLNSIYPSLKASSCWADFSLFLNSNRLFCLQSTSVDFFFVCVHTHFWWDSDSHYLQRTKPNSVPPFIKFICSCNLIFSRDAGFCYVQMIMFSWPQLKCMSVFRDCRLCYRCIFILLTTLESIGIASNPLYF